jgi:ATPase family associated with various cellular activities (AAA)/Winged helix domain, variant
MTDFAKWQEDNARYLANAVARLRTLLERRADETHASELVLPPAPPTQELPKPQWRWFRRKPPAVTELPNAAASLPVASPSTDLVAAELVMDPPAALVILGERFALSPFEQEILLLCAAMELDTRIGALCARAQGNPTRPYPTFALALSLFSDPTWDALSPERPLRYWRLIELNQPGAQPLTASPLRIDERILNYLKGLNYLDDRLTPLLAPIGIAEHRLDLPVSQQLTVDSIVRHLKQATSRQATPLIQLLGPDASSKHLIAAHAASLLGLRVYRLPAALLPSQPAEIENLARLWERESLLLPMALYVDAHDSETEMSPGGRPVALLLDRVGGITFVGVRNVSPGPRKASIIAEIGKPTAAEQKAAWAGALAADAGQMPELLAGQFNLDILSIERIVSSTLGDTETDNRPLQDRLWSACLAATRPQIENLAQRIEPKAGWKDIVLPATEMDLLDQIADQVGQRSRVYEAWGFSQKMSRGLGITALFAGESGTGKTMAAEVLANRLRLNLYRIDLSAVVSKYIGETEKNLRRLFDAAEDGGTILFFDEADALFGKRSEVKDSHDRYANIELDYLLQRMEAYRGLAILATNMKSALDPAFLRRLRFVVNFPYPGMDQRKAIWQKVFPAGTPTTGLDFERLARLNLAGGHIHNIALNAAFLAAQAGTAVTMPLILAAARTEFRKLDRSINEADFRWTVAPGVVA